MDGVVGGWQLEWSVCVVHTHKIAQEQNTEIPEPSANTEIVYNITLGLPFEGYISKEWSGDTCLFS